MEGGDAMSAIDQDFVRDLIERHSDASGGNGRDFHNGAYARMADEIEQAIEATLGPCNCTNGERTGERTTTVDETERISISWQDGRHVTIHVMECFECGQTYEHVNGGYEFCPHCGRRIVEVDG